MDNSRKGKKNKVRPGYGINDFYKFYSKNYTAKRNKVTSQIYKRIVREFNQSIVDEIIFSNYEFKLPYRLGTFSLRKLKPKVEINNGVIVNKNPINIRATMDLWDKDENAKSKRIKIRYVNKHTNGYIFFIKYFKKNAIFNNKSAYSFVFFRKINNQIHKAVTEYNIDTYLI